MKILGLVLRLGFEVGLAFGLESGLDLRRVLPLPPTILIRLIIAHPLKKRGFGEAALNNV